jgi:hypothetical protein
MEVRRGDGSVIAVEVVGEQGAAPSARLRPIL